MKDFFATITSLLNPPMLFSRDLSKKKKFVCLPSYQLKAKINGHAVCIIFTEVGASAARLIIFVFFILYYTVKLQIR